MDALDQMDSQGGRDLLAFLEFLVVRDLLVYPDFLVQRELQALQDFLDAQATREPEVYLDVKVPQDPMEPQADQDSQEPQVYLALVVKVPLDKREAVVIQECWDLQEVLDLQVLPVLPGPSDDLEPWVPLDLLDPLDVDSLDPLDHLEARDLEDPQDHLDFLVVQVQEDLQEQMGSQVLGALLGHREGLSVVDARM